MVGLPNTGPPTAAGVDDPSRVATTGNTDGPHPVPAAATSNSSIHSATEGTVVAANTKEGSNPNVDTHYAAQLRPSKLHGRWLSIMVNCLAGVGFICFGYDQGVMSSLLTLDSFIEVFPETTGGFGNLQSFLVASYLIGCLIGALMNLKLGDWLGRKKTIIVGGIGMIVGTVLQAASVNYGMMIFSRIFNGIFNGLLTSTVPTYQSECAQPHRRGQLLLLSGSLITFGVAISYWIGLGFYYTTGTVQWRLPIALQGPFIVLMLVMIWIFRLPESPRWLAAKGRHAECLAVLAALEGKSVDDPKVLKTWQGIVDAVSQSAGEFALKELFTHGKSQHFRRTLLGVLAQCFQQISGINIITYYLTSILADMGIGPELSRVLAGVNGTVYFMTSLIALPIIERIGRRRLMIWTVIAMGITFVVLAGLYNINAQGNRAAQVVSVLCLFLFNTWFSIGWLGMTWLYPAEVTPLRIRAPANALATASNWLWNFFVVMVTGPMFANIGWGTYAFFAACNIVIILPVVWIYFPETKKYSLEELDLIFAIAHDQGVNPVGISRRGDLPAAGSKEAEEILGVRKYNPDMNEKLAPTNSRFSGGGQMKRFVSREKTKPATHHNENASQQV